MIKGVGVDIARVERMEEILGSKVLTGNEEYKNRQHFAGLWAAKEAILKAIGCGISDISFKDIEIVYDTLGAPKVILSEKAQRMIGSFGAKQVLISISHEKEYAVAFAVLE